MISFLNGVSTFWHTDYYETIGISQREYLEYHKDIEYQLRQLAPSANGQKGLEQLARFLADVAGAWAEANKEQRNKLARVLFEEVRLDSGGMVVAVRPRPELEPFSDLNHEAMQEKMSQDFEKWRPRRDLNPRSPP